MLIRVRNGAPDSDVIAMDISGHDIEDRARITISRDEDGLVHVVVEQTDKKAQRLVLGRED